MSTLLGEVQSAMFIGKEFAYDKILNRADEVMYLAKESGRNKVQIYHQQCKTPP